MGDDLLEQIQEQAKQNAEQMTGGAAAEAPPAVEEVAPPVVEEILADMAAQDVEVVEVAAPAPHAAPAHREHAAPRAQPHKQRTYTVKSGDTLSAIGAHFGVSWQKIAQINHVENPDLIFPGQTFVIPD